MTQALSCWLLARGGRARAGLTFLAGLGAGLAFVPVSLIPLWPLGAAITLFYLFHARTRAGRLAPSFLFCYGQMISGLYWVSLAPTVSPSFYFLIPLALIVLPAFAALFGTAALFVASWFRRDPAAFACAAVAAWLVFEWRRGIDLTGFAWNRAGMVWAGEPLTLQLAALGGIPALSFVTLVVSAGLFLMLVARARLGGALIAGALLPLLLFGAYRLASVPQADLPPVPDVKVRLVQANVTKNTWDGAAVLDQHLRLSQAAPLSGVSHVIWPEGSVRDFPDANLPLRRYMADQLAPAPYSLVFGRRTPDTTTDPNAQTMQPRAAHLSAYLIDHRSLEFDTYDKSKLVPFGEYIPYKFIFDRLGFAALTGQFLDRVPGSGPKTLQVGNSARIGAFICYDSINTGRLVDPADRPDFLVTLTEDAWYILPAVPVLAKTPGPYQHLAEARVRAVEEGLSIARASNPGISGVIDPLGRLASATLGLNESGYLDALIPAALGPPLYSRIGPDRFYLLLTAVAILAAFGFFQASSPAKARRAVS